MFMAKKEKKDLDLWKKKYSLREIVPIALISLLIGTLFGGIITYKKDKLEISKVPEELEELVQVYDSISENYYHKVDKKSLVDSAIEGMIGSLDDPYSVFLNKNESTKFNETISGEYVGIGATVSFNEDKLEVIEVLDSSPAKKAGLKEKDIILKINGEDLTNKSLSEITNMIRGEKNTTVSLLIKRDNKEKRIEIVREDIEIDSVESEVIEKDDQKIGYLSIDTFASNSYTQFKQKLEKLEKKKIDSLIIDVRDNPGGHLTQATGTMELFLKKGKILYQIEQKGKNQKMYDQTSEYRKYKVVVLTNHSSASASEILASSLKESYQAILVGEATYGKGTVQKAYQLSSGNTVKYTTQKWLTAKGEWINEKGVSPDYEVSLDEEYIKNPVSENDNQLNKSLEILTEKEDK